MTGGFRVAQFSARHKSILAFSIVPFAIAAIKHLVPEDSILRCFRNETALSSVAFGQVHQLSGRRVTASQKINFGPVRQNSRLPYRDSVRYYFP